MFVLINELKLKKKNKKQRKYEKYTHFSTINKSRDFTRCTTITIRGRENSVFLLGVTVRKFRKKLNDCLVH